MDKQDELAIIIGDAYDSYDGVVSAPNEVRRAITIDAIAAAVRSFMGSPEVVDAMAAEMWNDEFMRATGRARLVPWSDAAKGEHDRYIRLARAALSAAIGEDIGGGRG